ncbi:MAG TPA: HD domain-containing phosphohydrolase [Thermoleophilaceae bacterium]|nr:HD domain-containing phosphohydrolase [Thermoleophilaceae bacterium]
MPARASLIARWTVRLLGAWLVVFEACRIAGAGFADGPWFGKGVHDVVLVAASLLCLARAILVARERAAWALIGLGLLSWSLGEIYYTLVIWDAESIPIPSPADAGYLLFPPLAFAGLATLLRARVRNAPRTLWVDGLTAALAAAALSAAIVFHAVLGSVGGEPMAVATNLAYPLGDLLLLGLVVGAFALNGWRLQRTWVLLGLGIGTFWVADSLYLVFTAQGTYEPGSVFDVGWWAGIVLVARAAWTPAETGDAVQRAGIRLIALPTVFAAVGLALLVFAAFIHVTPLAVLLAGASLATVMVRLLLTFRDYMAMLARSREESLSDSLTGLGNRRALRLDLEAALESSADDDPVVLALFDLDGFKHYNDSFGHPAGDALLARLGEQFARTLRGRGRAYRMGGDEFCALVEPGAEVAEPIVAAAAAALSESGEGFTIGCSYGVVTLPWEASGAADALGLADRRMYAQKRDGRASASRQSKDVLVQTLLERGAELGDHHRAVAGHAERVARLFGLDADEIARIRHAAELHDIGKVAIPDDILNKPGALDEAEWEFVRSHTVVGERIVAAAPALAPVAALVRSTHEHFDGSGYPDATAGRDIPLGARIVSVCDAYDAMISERPYGDGLSPAEARAELRRCAGAQFDPVVVDLLGAVLDGIDAAPDLHADPAIRVAAPQTR